MQTAASANKNQGFVMKIINLCVFSTRLSLKVKNDNQFTAGFPKLLVHRYPLDTVAGLHVAPKFFDVSLKKRLSVRISH